MEDQAKKKKQLVRYPGVPEDWPGMSLKKPLAIVKGLLIVFVLAAV